MVRDVQLRALLQAFFAFLLLFPKFPLTSDIAAIKIPRNILLQR